MFEITLENVDILDSGNSPFHYHKLTPEESDAMNQWREYCESELLIFDKEQQRDVLAKEIGKYRSQIYSWVLSIMDKLDAITYAKDMELPLMAGEVASERKARIRRIAVEAYFEKHPNSLAVVNYWSKRN